ncbi:MAG: helix-turn-helix transcriptional regulator [Gammaproteobacteria bacterium]|nr:helix-turn-helix transcriptional regulator [Gammaproteobacteria bacterium]
MAIEDRILKGSVRRALDLIGDRWTLLILLSAFCGVQRFDEWKSLHGISPSILSNRLKRLIERGILEQQPVEAGSRRQRYTLTEMGSDLFNWALAVWSWERNWVYRDTHHPVRLLHKTCGHSTSANFVCGHCDGRIGYYSIRIERGPGYDAISVDTAPGSRRTKTPDGPGANDTRHIGRFVDIIGDRWSFLIISAAYFGVTRFDDFQSQLHIATNILSDRLRRLADDGMLARNRYREKPARYEYILTEKNIAFYQVPLMLALWGDQWLPSDVGPAFLRFHDHCGKNVTVKPLCNHCGDILERADIDFESVDEF